MTMCYRAATSITIFVFISSTTINAHAKVEQVFASETGNNLAQQNVLALAEESPLQATPLIDTVGVSADNVAEPDEHHRIVILVPQLVHPGAASASARARKPKKKKPVAPRPKKPKTHHHHHPVVPVVHSGKVIHAHHHHGAVDHGHKHAGKAKHTHKHYVNANHKHGHYGVGRITHKHIGPIKPPPPPPPPHKPKHPHLTGGGAVDVFNQNSYFNPPLPQQQQRLRQNPYQYQQYNNQPQAYQPQAFQPQPPPHLQHQQQVLHHRNSATPNFFNAPAAAAGAVDPYSTFFNGGGNVAPFGNRGRTANDRHDFLAPSSVGNGPAVAQLIQIRRLPSSKEDKSFDSFIDKNTRSKLTAAALAFGNENLNNNDNNENEDEAEVEAAAADADEDNENEIETDKENETENENENENEKDDEAGAGYIAAGALERAIEDVAFDAIPRQNTNAFGRTRRPFVAGAVPAASEENFATLQLNGIDHGGAGVHQNEASLQYATFANPPSQVLVPKNKIIAFSDAYHYQY